jgi:hypothetical protein
VHTSLNFAADIISSPIRTLRSEIRFRKEKKVKRPSSLFNIPLPCAATQEVPSPKFSSQADSSTIQHALHAQASTRSLRRCIHIDPYLAMPNIITKHHPIHYSSPQTVTSSLNPSPPKHPALTLVIHKSRPLNLASLPSHPSASSTSCSFSRCVNSLNRRKLVRVDITTAPELSRRRNVCCSRRTYSIEGARESRLPAKRSCGRVRKRAVAREVEGRVWMNVEVRV